jgi:hypothetical protein
LILRIALSSPLDLQSWIKIFIPDTYKLVCRALGCPDTTTTAQIEAEIALSLQADRTSRSRLNTHRAGEESATETAAHSVSSEFLLLLLYFEALFCSYEA